MRVRHEPCKPVLVRRIPVSIPTRPERRVQPVCVLDIHDARLNVSIPTRPERRVQPPSRVEQAQPPRFQSPPAPRGGCNAIATATTRAYHRGFNPHPPREAGATRCGAWRCWAARCSIPTRPERRVQLTARSGPRMTKSSFQSPPAPRGGCNIKENKLSVFGCRDVSIPTRPERRVQRRKTCASLGIAHALSPPPAYLIRQGRQQSG